MALQRPDGGDDHGRIRRETAVMTFQVPELFIADVRAEAGFSHMVVAQLQTHAVRYDRTLADGDIGKGTCVNEYGLAFDGLNKIRIDGFRHPCGHRTVHFQIGGGYRSAVAIVGNNDLAHAFPHILEVAGHGQNGHDFGRNRDIEARAHHEAVGLAVHTVHADDDVSERLAAEVHDPAHIDVGGVDVQTFHVRHLEQFFVIVVALVLHARGKGHHGEVVGVHDGVDVAGEAEGILGKRNALGKPPAGGRTLHAHGWTARRLADGGGGTLATSSESLHETDGRGGLALAEGGRRNGGDVDVFAVGSVVEPPEDRTVVNLAHDVAVGKQLAFEQSQIPADLIDCFHPGFRVLSNFPVRMLFRIKRHEHLLFGLDKKYGKGFRHPQTGLLL